MRLEIDARGSFDERFVITDNAFYTPRPGLKAKPLFLDEDRAESILRKIDLSYGDLQRIISHSHFGANPFERGRANLQERAAQILAGSDFRVFQIEEEEDTDNSKPPVVSGGTSGPKREESLLGPAYAPPKHTLGPHDRPGYVPERNPTPAPAPVTLPQSMEECEQRLTAARERLKKDGYQPKYSDEQLHAQAQRGELDDRFVVRLIESKYAGDDGYLGQQDGAGRVKFWSTTFNQAENADTDPETLAPLFGFTPKPGADYTLVLVDTQAPGAGQSLSLVPTHANLGSLAKAEIEGIDPDKVDAVMTPEYNQVYAAHMTSFEESGLDVRKEKDISDYANNSFNTQEDITLFKTRAAIHKEMGANQHFTGDGTTKNLLDAGGNCGVMETLTLDKNPQTLAKLESSNGAKRLAAKRL